jgi:hypothetical protein
LTLEDLKNGKAFLWNSMYDQENKLKDLLKEINPHDRNRRVRTEKCNEYFWKYHTKLKEQHEIKIAAAAAIS